MVIFKLKYNFVETPRKFIIAELSIRKLGSSSVLIIIIDNNYMSLLYISTDEDPSLGIESSVIVNLAYLVFPQIIFHSCLLFPNCTRNHAIIYIIVY